MQPSSVESAYLQGNRNLEVDSYTNRVPVKRCRIFLVAPPLFSRTVKTWVQVKPGKARINHK